MGTGGDVPFRCWLGGGGNRLKRRKALLFLFLLLCISISVPWWRRRIMTIFIPRIYRQRTRRLGRIYHFPLPILSKLELGPLQNLDRFIW